MWSHINYFENSMTIYFNIHWLRWTCWDVWQCWRRLGGWLDQVFYHKLEQASSSSVPLIWPRRFYPDVTILFGPDDFSLTIRLVLQLACPTYKLYAFHCYLSAPDMDVCLARWFLLDNRVSSGCQCLTQINGTLSSG